jgi:hypothetical protein
LTGPARRLSVLRPARSLILGDRRIDKGGADAELIVLTKVCLSPEAIDRRPKDAKPWRTG